MLKPVAGTETASRVVKISLIVLSIGFMLGILLSALIIRDLMKTMTHVIHSLRRSSEEVSGASSQSAASASNLKDCTIKGESKASTITA